MSYDSIIVGAGPAGMSAAIYLARQKLNFIIISQNVGGYVTQSSEVGNYLGFNLIDGGQLAEKFEEHIKIYGVNIKSPEEVKKISKAKNGFKVVTGRGEYLAKTVLIATGEKHRKLNIPGEDEFLGRGVTYCATCDAPVFGGKDIAVIGGGNSAMEAALFGAKYAKKVYLLNINKELAGESHLITRVKKEKKIQVFSEASAGEIFGGKFVEGLKYQQGGSEKKISVQGVFIEIGLVPVSDFIKIVKKDKWNEIEVDKYNKTSVEGIFAAGDVTDVTEKQIAVAVGEGCKAALGVIKYLQK